ncbi:hypothetical protein ACLOJK_021385 [Asimina triloba]
MTRLRGIFKERKKDLRMNGWYWIWPKDVMTRNTKIRDKPSYFINAEAFDPPLDMSQDTDIRDYENEKNAHDDHIQLEASHCKEMKFGSEHHSSTSGRTASRKHKERSCEEEKNIISTPPGRTGTEVPTATIYGLASDILLDLDLDSMHLSLDNIMLTYYAINLTSIYKQEVQMKSFCESVTGSCSVSSETCVAKGSNDVKAVTDEYRHSSVSNANGYLQLASAGYETKGLYPGGRDLSVQIYLTTIRYSTFIKKLCFVRVTSQSPDWLDPSLRLNVPLVDVDKVRCIIRNIVRDWAPEGRRERDACYKPILEELDRLFPARCKSSYKLEVCSAQHVSARSKGYSSKVGSICRAPIL